MPFYNHHPHDLWDNLRRLRDEEPNLSPQGEAFADWLIAWMSTERRRLSRIAEIDGELE